MVALMQEDDEDTVFARVNLLAALSSHVLAFLQYVTKLYFLTVQINRKEGKEIE